MYSEKSLETCGKYVIIILNFHWNISGAPPQNIFVDSKAREHFTCLRHLVVNSDYLRGVLKAHREYIVV